jgi:hypothetical protein
VSLHHQQLGLPCVHIYTHREKLQRQFFCPVILCY